MNKNVDVVPQVNQPLDAQMHPNLTWQPVQNIQQAQASQQPFVRIPQPTEPQRWQGNNETESDRTLCSGKPFLKYQLGAYLTALLLFSIISTTHGFLSMMYFGRIEYREVANELTFYSIVNFLLLLTVIYGTASVCCLGRKSFNNFLSLFYIIFFIYFIFFCYHAAVMRNMPTTDYLGQIRKSYLQIMVKNNDTSEIIKPYMLKSNLTVKDIGDFSISNKIREHDILSSTSDLLLNRVQRDYLCCTDETKPLNCSSNKSDQKKSSYYYNHSCLSVILTGILDLNILDIVILLILILTLLHIGCCFETCNRSFVSF